MCSRVEKSRGPPQPARLFIKQGSRKNDFRAIIVTRQPRRKWPDDRGSERPSIFPAIAQSPGEGGGGGGREKKYPSGGIELVRKRIVGPSAAERDDEAAGCSVEGVALMRGMVSLWPRSRVTEIRYNFPRQLRSLRIATN